MREKNYKTVTPLSRIYEKIGFITKKNMVYEKKLGLQPTLSLSDQPTKTNQTNLAFQRKNIIIG